MRLLNLATNVLSAKHLAVRGCLALCGVLGSMPGLPPLRPPGVPSTTPTLPDIARCPREGEGAKPPSAGNYRGPVRGSLCDTRTPRTKAPRCTARP